MRVAIITGVPGTGKTTVANAIGSRIGAQVVRVAELALKRELVAEYDFEHKTSTVDLDKLKPALLEEIRKLAEEGKNLIIVDSVFPCVLDNELVELVVVLRADPNVLRERLEKRKWPLIKVRENIEAEVLETVKTEALECFEESKLLEVKNNTKTDLERIVSLLVEVLGSKRYDE
uniref:Putative adenylate kinase n=1 Tax=Fervidicoccus fontis TaxID=683846 RepID=A0A7J3ZKW8_9CREN